MGISWFIGDTKAWRGHMAVPPLGGLRGRPGLRAGRSRLPRRCGMAALILLPSIFSVIYYGAIATPRYVSEASFILRTGDKSAGLRGLGSLLASLGAAQSQDDTQAVREFIASRDAILALEERLPLAAMFEREDADLFSRYPNVLYSRTREGLYWYLQNRITVIVSDASGIEKLRVEAFRPDDAQRIAATLMQLGEELVNRLNQRNQRDAVAVAVEETESAERRLVASQLALTAFRNREAMLDPSRSALITIGLIGHLSGELAETRAQIAAMKASSPENPEITTLLARAAALQEQIALERGGLSSGTDGIAEKIAQYQTLDLERAFADRNLTTAMASLEIARAEARRQQLYLERVVEPGLADEPRAPRRLEIIVTVLGLNVIGFAVLWLLISGLRTHAGRSLDA